MRFYHLIHTLLSSHLSLIILSSIACPIHTKRDSPKENIHILLYHFQFNHVLEEDNLVYRPLVAIAPWSLTSAYEPQPVASLVRPGKTRLAKGWMRTSSLLSSPRASGRKRNKRRNRRMVNVEGLSHFALIQDLEGLFRRGLTPT